MARLDAPVVSVIVPARNEEACLGRCLESLVSQTGIPFELIVVDDASTDRTGEIARSFAGSENPTVTVIPAPPLPEDWTGKNNAMSAGARIAKGKWLLFTDADTFHKPGSLARAVAEAEEQGAALLSYSPEQEVHTLWERAVMPVIFAELAATYPPAKVRDPKSPIAAANGQYLMVSREAYDAVAGHTKIASDLLEDVAMARMVKASGRKIWFRYGGDAVRTRMYRSWGQMREGWTKNLALLFKHPGLTGLRYLVQTLVLVAALVRFVELAFLRWPRFSSGSPLPYWDQPLVNWTAILALLGWLLILSLIRVLKAQFPARALFVSMAGVPVFSYLLFRSVYVHKLGRVAWKQREYPLSRR